jgi:hypothetical protein
MAASRLPSPGTKLGPCKRKCEHRDCAETRRMSESICRICSKPIGYETRFYGDGPGFVHAICLEDEVEAERKAAQQRSKPTDHVADELARHLPADDDWEGTEADPLCRTKPVQPGPRRPIPGRKMPRT